jgi:hypothetical protein
MQYWHNNFEVELFESDSCTILDVTRERVTRKVDTKPSRNGRIATMLTRQQKGRIQTKTCRPRKTRRKHPCYISLPEDVLDLWKVVFVVSLRFGVP